MFSRAANSAMYPVFTRSATAASRGNQDSAQTTTVMAKMMVPAFSMNSRALSHMRQSVSLRRGSW